MPCLVVPALEVDASLAQERHDDLEGLLEAAHPVVEGVAEGLVLGLVPPGAEPQHDAPAADLVEGVGHLRQQRRVAEARAGDERPEVDAAGRLRHRAEHRPHLPDAAALSLRHVDRRDVAGRGAPEDQVVGRLDRVEADLLAALRDLAQDGPGHRLAVPQRPDPDRQCHPQLHPALSRHALASPGMSRLHGIRSIVAPGRPGPGAVSGPSPRVSGTPRRPPSRAPSRPGAGAARARPGPRTRPAGTGR